MALSSLHAETSHFNDAQLAAVQADDGPMLIEAGPGAGKTTVLTWRAVYLLQHLQVPPERICVVTFTRAAAEQLRDRIDSVVPSRGKAITAATIHSLAATLLRRWGRLSGHERFLSDHEQLDVVRELLRRESVAMTDELPGEVLSEMGAARNRMQAPEAFEPQSVDKEVFVRVAQRYRGWKRDERYLDYDDLLVHLYVLLRDNGRVPQSEFDHLLVDEFQDTSMLQYELLRMLAGSDGRLYVVGDVDQAIYSWRGAGPEVFLRFGKDYPATGRVVLDRNYRASASLVEVTNSLIGHNENRTPKRIRSAAAGSGVAPVVLVPDDDGAEATAFGEQLERAHEKDGMPWREMAVIYRNNYQALPFIAELSRRGIPFRMLGEPPNPFRHWVGQDILTYVRLALGPLDPKAVERIMYRPNRYISNAATRAVAERLRRGETLTDAYGSLELRSFQLDRITQLEQHLWRLERLAPGAAIAFIRETIGYDEYLAEQSATSPARRAETTAMAALLQTVAAGFTDLNEFVAFADVAGTRPRGWWRLLAASSSGDGDAQGGSGGLPRSRRTAEAAAFGNGGGEDGTEAVTFTTCHSAKGLEFDLVAIAGLVEGMLPAVQADTEEERRLAYVAMTRARQRLILSSPSNLLGEKRTPSRFVHEATGVAPATKAAGSHGATVIDRAGGGAAGRARARKLPADRLADALAEAFVRFVPEAEVKHKTFGRGRVQSLDEAKGYITIVFEHYGEKQLLLQACVENELLERVD